MITEYGMSFVYRKCVRQEAAQPVNPIPMKSEVKGRRMRKGKEKQVCTQEKGPGN